MEKFVSWEGYIDMIMGSMYVLKKIIVPTCVSAPFLLIPTIPMGTCWRGTTQKVSQQRNGFALSRTRDPASQQLRGGPRHQL